MTIRRVIFWAHLVSGLAVGSVIFIMALTGVTLTFEPQVVEFAERNIRRVSVLEGAAPLAASQILAKAAEAKLGGRVSSFSLKSDPAASVVVSFGREDGSLYVDPYTGAVLGHESKTHDFLHWVEDIHRRLGAKDKGRAVTGFCNFIFLFMVLSGIYIWFPRNWNAASLKSILLFNRKLSGRQRDWNWHNVIGFWCLPMLLVTTLTGLVMSYGWANGLLFRLMGSEPPPLRAQQRMGGPEKGGEKADARGKEMNAISLPITQNEIEKILSEVNDRVSEWESVNFRLGQKPGAPVSVSIQESKKKYKTPSPRSQMTYDLQAGEVVKWEPFSENSLGKKARVWVKYLHTGMSFGLVTQIVAFVSAIGVLFLVWTGFALSWRRFFSKQN